MTEIKEALAILKARWLEVTIIIAFYLIRPLIAVLLFALFAHRFSIVNRLYIPIILLLPMVSTTLRSGFLRTVHLEVHKRQSIWYLLQTGVHFLWRMIVLRALYSLPFLTLTLLSSRIIIRQVPVASFSQIFFWFQRLFNIGFNIILVKLILLIPALIIVLDCRVFESFKFLKYFKLSNMKSLVALFYFLVALNFIWTILRTSYDAATVLGRILEIVPIAIINFISLIIGVAAVKFVGSVDLAYDRSLVSSNSEI